MMITFFYKLSSRAKAKAFDKIISRLSSEFGHGKLYPFSKVAAGNKAVKSGTDNWEYARQLPDVAIYVNHRVKYFYQGEPDEFKFFAWFSESMEKVSYLH